MVSSDIDPILKPSVLKIARAKHHIRDLKREVETYLATKPAKLIVRNQREPLQTIRYVKRETPIPEAISLIAGDAVHNLRCALDLIIFAIVGDKTPAPQSVQFPWAWTREKLDATITHRQLRYAGENVIRAVKELKPYKGGNKAIEAVHLLDISDKHKLILTTTGSVMMTPDEFRRFVPLDVPPVQTTT